VLSLREFCNRVGIVEKPCAAIIKNTVTKAIETWPALVDASTILPKQKEMVLKHFYAHPFVQQQLVRKTMLRDTEKS
jgi:serine/threonine-protein kinase HipA